MLSHPAYFRAQTSGNKLFSSRKQRGSASGSRAVQRPRWTIGKGGKDDASLLFVTLPGLPGALGPDTLGTNLGSAVYWPCDTEQNP